MILLSFLIVQAAGFERAPQDPSHIPWLRTMQLTCQAAKQVFVCLNQHNLWLQPFCAMALHADICRFVKGYVQLASICLNDSFNGYAIKPKLHLVKHEEMEYDEALQRGDEIIINWNLWSPTRT